LLRRNPVKTLWLAILSIALAASPAQAQTYKVLYNFSSILGDPNTPVGTISQGRDGSLYTTTGKVFANSTPYIVKITPAGKLIVLSNLSSTGVAAGPGMTLGTDGGFYGVFQTGGAHQLGSVFKVDPAGSISTFFSFSGSDGAYPFAPPIQAVDGNWYGTTQRGGDADYGTVYQVSPSGASTVLCNFGSDCGGKIPELPLVQAASGNFYSGTSFGGDPNFNFGTIFEISPSGKYLVVLDVGSAGLGGPAVAMVEGTDGSLYGRAGNPQVVFKIAAGVLSVLHNLGGGDPSDGLAQATDGNLYGMASGGVGCGVIFRVSPLGDFAPIFTFPGDGSLGCSPVSTLIQHTNGLLYGTTFSGGSANSGVFFSLDLGLGPFVTFLPAARQVGHTVEILGQGFTGTSAVTINGVPATFTVYSNTYLTATVPDGATTGFIKVTTPNGTLTSNKQFQVKPQITSFSPTSGPVGGSVVVTGVSLSQTSKITFNSVLATSFTVNSDTQVTVTVPAGATTAKIGVTTTGAPAYSGAAFTVTQ
jgi:uncharacterized repeat protein (TIGR03803 family)